MKIVFVSGNLRVGGAQRVLSILANEMSLRGHIVTVITKAPECDYSLEKNVTWRSIFLKDELKKSIFDKIARRFKFIPRLLKQIELENPDIIISFLVGMNGKNIIISKILNIPIIVTEHTNHKADVNILSWIERRWIYKLANAVTVLTEYDYINYYSHFMKHAYIMPNPVSFVSVQKVTPRGTIILASGSLDRWSIKGFDNLIRIFSKIIKIHPDWKLKIAGPGDVGKDHLLQLSSKLGTQNNIEFLGYCKNIDEIMQQSSIFVLSSRYEGFSMVLAEAMSQGCACISFDCIAGPSEIIEHEVDGILVEDQNMQQMEAEICRLIEDKQLREKLAINAIKNIQRYSVESVCDKWTNLIQKTIKLNY